MSPAEHARANGWTVGTRLSGSEGFGVTVIEITAIGEQVVVAKTVSHKGVRNPRPWETTWHLGGRKWTPVE